MQPISKGFKEIILVTMAHSLRYYKFQIKMENLSWLPVIQLCQTYSAILKHSNLPISAILHKGGNVNREQETW